MEAKKITGVENEKEENINLKKNEINLIYKGNYKEERIFGEDFVERNKNNIKLNINGTDTKLVKSYKLKFGNNNIKLLIMNKLTDLSRMFYKCDTLYNIEELKYLDISGVNGFGGMGGMFEDCKSLSNVKGLENWDVSNIKSFHSFFRGCSKLSDISALKNWNVSKVETFFLMFEGCYNLSDLSPLKNWNVSNAFSFQHMFEGCSKLSDISPLQNWNVKDDLPSSSVAWMFKGCSSKSDIKSDIKQIIIKWKKSQKLDVSNFLR